MARVTMKLVEGMSGMIGDLVFRNVNGTIIVSSRPGRTRKKKKQSERQQLTRSKFKAVAAAVKRKLLDPKVKEYYQEQARKLKLPNAYTAAVKEAMQQANT